MSKVKLVQGNKACALGAIAAGAKFFGGYPITPSTEIAEYIAAMFPKVGGKFVQMEDEIGSIGAIIGASVAGKKAFTATSGPGYSLMQELIGYAAITDAPIVIVDVQRAGPCTGLPTLPSQGDVQQARWGTHGDHPAIALSPSSVTECYYETINAFNLAEQFRCPVTLLMDEVVGHLKERFDVPEDYKPVIVDRKPAEAGKPFIPFQITEDGVPPYAPWGSGERYHTTGLTHAEGGFYSSVPEEVDAFIRRLTNKVESKAEEIFRCQTIDVEDAEVLIIAFGSTARSAEEALEVLREKGIKAGLLRPIIIWPFPDNIIRSYCEGKKAVVVPEMNLGQYVREVERVAPKDVPVYALGVVTGEPVTPLQIIEKVEGVL